MLRRGLTLFVLVLLLVTPTVAVNAQDLPEQVCLITNESGRINDGTFNTFAYEGMTSAATDFDLETTFIETTAATDYERNFETCIDDGYDIIVTVGFLITDATLAAATEYPDVQFIGVDQFFATPLPNLVGLQFREDQGGFLAGAMAAQMTESNIIGGVYGVEIPPVIKFRNGFELGARYVNPEVTVLGVYNDSFITPDEGGRDAEQLIGEGADVILGAGGPTGSGAITLAAQQGAWVIGVDLDEFFTTFGGGDTPGADRLITSAIKRVDTGVYDMIAAAATGVPFPASSIYVLEVANGGIGYAPANDAAVPQEVSTRMEEILAGLRDGTIMTGVDPVTGALLEPIPAVATAAGSFTTLLAAAEAAGLVETLGGPGPLTVFAPTDEAFAASLEAMGMTAEQVLADTELLTSVLSYHVIVGRAATSTIIRNVLLPEGEMSLTVPTAQGADVTITVDEMGGVMVNDANVIIADVHAGNGVIHVIDSVLLPPM
jgi:basic membrane lipoprotein Med (substrate-binding protein (PBP1-ABC) superfamily)